VILCRLLVEAIDKILDGSLRRGRRERARRVDSAVACDGGGYGASRLGRRRIHSVVIVVDPGHLQQRRRGRGRFGGDGAVAIAAPSALLYSVDAHGRSAAQGACAGVRGRVKNNKVKRSLPVFARKAAVYGDQVKR
jgi:hypothetical protein